ncbi:hypothetical protein D1007_50228 [Hordeum vulgare]|nr:hypothetical protein D1007_50228 [Hordeum vulgare]
MTTSRRDVEVAPGFTFCPQHKELTDLYLRRQIDGEPLPGATGRFIHEVDVYSAEPEKLVSAFQKAPGTGNGDKQPVWYFFSRVRHRHPGSRKKNARGGATRKPRTIEGVVGKHWHSEHRAKPVEGGSAVGGYMQDFSYCMVKRSESGKKNNVRLGWIMYEYGISEEHGGGDLVLCKILPSVRTGGDGQETTAAVSTTISSKKRKRNDPVPEDTTARARPRQTLDQDQHQQPLPAESLRSASPTTTEDADEYHRHRHTSADETLFDATELLDNLWHHMASEQAVYNCYGSGDTVPHTAVAQVQEMEPSNFFDTVDGFYHQNSVVMVGPGGHLAMAPAAQPEVQETPLPSNFFHSVEQEFSSLYHNNDVTVGPAGDDVVALPAAQPEEEAAGLVQSIITADRKDQHHQMEKPEEPAADEAIYGLPCPAVQPSHLR